ncbi:unnamed protein product [Thelazia callipaeda]|uniref:Rod_C domain-containing protein n=1 Tax=Thelazia callipaeda TaxID=103827 RepID=A0A0N5CNM0_THECL|nr:unnamed protein product [Thelazia callipaeda]
MDGRLLIWDTQTTMLVSSIVLLKTDEMAKDFLFFDMNSDAGGKISEHSQLVLIYAKITGICQLEIRNLGGEVLYSVLVTEGTFLLSTLTRETKMILFMHIAAEKHSDLNVINVHSICESHPKMFVEHLLDRQQWNEALEFARKFSFNLEKIYVARIRYFVDTLIVNRVPIEKAEFDEFLEWMSRVSDQNWVAEMCIAAIIHSSNHLWVKKILEFVADLQITDDETKEKLASLRYNYQSYREIIYPWKKRFNSFSTDHLLSEFLNICSYEHIFEHFYKNGHFWEARLLWCRYQKTLKNWVRKKENLERLLEDIHSIIYDMKCDVMEALHLLEDIIPTVMVSDAIACCSLVNSFLLDLAREMEVKDPAEFPENSLMIATTMERIIQNFLKSSVTPYRQAEVAHIFSLMKCYSEDPMDVMGELNTYVRSLRFIKKLKNVYDFPMSYDSYQNQTVETICYMMLEGTNMEQVRYNIDKYVKPYMDEFKMDYDQTFFNYISKMAVISKDVISNTDLWYERCLTIVGCISNPNLRCEALITVTESANIPWAVQLSSAVYAMLRDPEVDYEMMSRLQNQCDLAALKERLVRSHIPIEMFEQYFISKYMFRKAIEFILQQELLGSLQTRLSFAFEVKMFQDNELQLDLTNVRKSPVLPGVIKQLSLRNNYWKITMLRDYMKEAFTNGAFPTKITQLMKFSKSLMVHQNLMFEVALDCALKCRNLEASLEYAKFAMQHIDIPSEQLLTLIVQSCGYGLWEMPELVKNTDFKLIALFVNLFESLIALCVPDHFTKLNEDETKKKWILRGIGCCSGVYHYNMDGAFFEKKDAIKQLATVARSVVFDFLNSTSLIEISGNEVLEYYKDMREAWKSFITYLVSNNQIMLAISTWLSFSSLPCYTIVEGVSNIHSEISEMITLFTERALAQSDADLELCLSVIFSVQIPDIKNILMSVKPCYAKRSLPHIAMLNFIYLSQIRAFFFNDHFMYSQLLTNYKICKWMKKFSELGAIFPENKNLDAAVQEFVRCLISPEVLVEFCEDFSLEATEALILYATTLALKATTTENNKLVKEMRFAISTSLQKIDTKENIFMRLYGFLMTLCPYSYEVEIYLPNFLVINEIISGMKRYVDQKNIDQVEILRRAFTTIRFLECTERTTPPTNHEIKWYHERQNFLFQQRNGNHGSAEKICDGKSLNSSKKDFLPSLETNLLINELPNQSCHRLPFHPFMFENEKDLQNTLLPMIYAELTLCNIDKWQMFIRALPEIEISKSDLVSTVILLVIQSYIAKGIELNESSFQQIKLLIQKTPNRLRTLKGLSKGSRNIPLGEAKLRFLSLGIEVVKEWLEESEHNLAEHEADDTDFLKQFLRDLQQVYKMYNIKYVLKKYGLMRAETFDLLSTPQILIEHIYAHEIDWNNCNDIDAKFPCIVQLAEILALDLSSLQDKIIQQWIDLNNQISVAFDPSKGNFTDLLKTPSKRNSIYDVYRLPFGDISVSRIVRLSRLGASGKVFDMLVDSFTKGSAEGRIRAACCLLRLLRTEEIQEVMKKDLFHVCSSLEIVLYSRMIDAYNIDLSIDTFLSTEKNILLKYLVNHGRQTPQLTLFMTAVVIDYEVVEPSLVEILSTNLYRYRNFDMLIELLNYCATESTLSHIKDFEKKWFCAAEWLFSCIEKGSEDEKQQLDRFLLFSLSCPMEYGSSINAFLHSLREYKLPVAQHLLTLASSAVAEEVEESKVCVVNSSSDLRDGKNDTKSAEN